jgi:phospholipid/cholesterol/gamma-HCH transport system substrate-binding protein
MTGESKQTIPPNEGELSPPSAHAGRREATVGLFVLLGLLAILTALFVFTEPATFRGRYVISTTVTDAGGVRRGDPVQLRGVTVGRIRGFAISPTGVVVQLEIEKRYRVPRDSHVELSTAALLGGSVAQIIPGESTEPAPPGAILPGSAAPPLPEKLGEVAAESRKALEKLEQLLSDRTVNGVEGSVEQLQALLSELAQMVASNRADVEHLTRSLSGAAKSAQKVASSPELERSVQRLDSITAKLDEAATSFDRASHSIDVVAGRIERGEGVLGRLSKDDTLYLNTNQAMVNLNQAVTQVQVLATDLRLNPKKYVHLSLF